MATSTAEFDQMLKKAMRLLHSNHPNSATELRLMLDEAIKQRYGPEKMLINTLSKRHLDLEKTFPGRAATPPPQPVQPEAEEIINLTNSPTKTISDSPDTIADSADEGIIAVTDVTGVGDVGTTLLTTVEDDGNLKEFGDLNCCVCGEMMFTATNRLIECSKCGTLYHQECHKPPITNEEASEDQQHTWQCDTCFNKPSTSKAAGIVPMVVEEPIPIPPKPKSSATSSRSSSSSNSSSPFYKQDQPSTSAAAAIATSTSKHHTSSSSSKKSSSHSSSSRSSSSRSSKHHESSSKRKSSK